MSLLFTPAVTVLLIVNGVIHLATLFASLGFPDQVGSFVYWFGLVPVSFAHGALWQPFTYMFLHGSLWHLGFNMLALAIFGGEVERVLGTRRFAWFYIGTGVAAGVLTGLLGWGQTTPVIGASGAIFAVLMAFGMFFPYRQIVLLLFLIIPVRMSARVFVALYGLIEVLLLAAGGGRGLAEYAHLSGLLFGWAWLKAPDWRASLERGARERTVRRQMRIVTVAREEERDLQAEVDGLLEKISRRGMAGLTAEEKRRLVDASERLKRL